MEEKNFITSNRLEAFYDAIIAIIVTVLVLELPQPATASLTSLWAIKTSYFAYLISFLVCTNLWMYHHMIYNHVEKINTKIIWQNIVVLLIVSLIPYLSVFVANNPFSLLAQVLYGLDFISMNISLYFMAKSLINVNSDQQELKEALNIKRNDNSFNFIRHRTYSGIYGLSTCNQCLLFNNNNQINYTFSQLILKADDGFVNHLNQYFIYRIFKR